MSLILEALKKLERDKQSPDRGFLVVAHVPWAAKVPRGRLWLGMAGSLLALGLAAAALYRAWPRERPGSPSPAVVPALPEATLPSRPAAAPPVPPASVTLPTVSLPVPARSSAVPRSAGDSETAPAPTKSPPAPSGVELRLNAISKQEGRWVAVLNDRLVREGDEFDGIRVLRIDEAEVEVEIAGLRRTVRF